MRSLTSCSLAGKTTSMKCKILLSGSTVYVLKWTAVCLWTCGLFRLLFLWRHCTRRSDLDLDVLLMTQNTSCCLILSGSSSPLLLFSFCSRVKKLFSQSVLLSVLWNSFRKARTQNYPMKNLEGFLQFLVNSLFLMIPPRETVQSKNYFRKRRVLHPGRS